MYFLNPIQDGPFQGCSWIGGGGKGGVGAGAKRPSLPKICYKNSTKMKLGTVIPYVQKTQKIYKSCETPLEFC